MGNGTGILAIGVEDDAVGTRGACHESVNWPTPSGGKRKTYLTSRVNTTLLNRKLLVRSGDGEIETLVVVVGVRVVVRADLLVVLVVAVALVEGGADLAGAVVVVAAGRRGLSGDEVAGGGGDGADCEEQGGVDGEAHFGWWF